MGVQIQMQEPAAAAAAASAEAAAEAEAEDAPPLGLFALGYMEFVVEGGTLLGRSRMVELSGEAATTIRWADGVGGGGFVELGFSYFEFVQESASDSSGSDPPLSSTSAAPPVLPFSRSLSAQ